MTVPVLPNSRHERFAQELAAGNTADKAYELAGFKQNRGNAASLKAKEHIATRVESILNDRAQAVSGATEKAIEKLALTKEWVISRLMENAERALQKVPVMDDEGRVTEYKYDGATANRALELLGKHLGILIDRKEIGEPGDFDALGDDDLAKAIREKAAALGVQLPRKLDS